MKTTLFLGPTLAAERAADLLGGLEVRPPVARGDVLRACNAGAERIGIIDGYFDHVPSVMHKEILYALERGVAVFGASSMGALRAAELHAFGMVGVGRIFEMYRDGILEEDDEVAVTHGPAESGYRQMSDALVDIRDRIEAAVKSGIIESDAGADIVAIVKALPYSMRSFRTAAESARKLDLGAGVAERLATFLIEPHSTLKERDALALLRRMADGADVPSRAPAPVERTVFFERLRLTVEREQVGAHDSSPGAPDEYREALLGLLAEEHAGVLLAPLTEDEMALMVHDFRTAHGLSTLRDVEEWLRQRDLSADELTAHLRELATIRKLEHLYGPEIAQRTRARIRIPRI